MKQTKPGIDLSEDQALELLTSDAFLIVNKSILRTFGPEVTIVLSNLLDKYKYFKRTDQLTEGNYFYALYDQMMEELKLTEYKIRLCRKILVENNIIELKKLPYRGGPPVYYVRLNIVHILDIIDVTPPVNIEDGNSLLRIIPSANIEGGDGILDIKHITPSVNIEDGDPSHLRNSQVAITINKKEQRSKEEKILKKKKSFTDKFLKRLPEPYQQDLLLRKLLDQYVAVRKRMWKIGWSDGSQKTALGKLEKYLGELTEEKIPLVRKTFEGSIENEWRGVFPERFQKKAKSVKQEQEVIENPRDLILKHFSGSTYGRVFYQYYEDAEELLSVHTKQDRGQLANYIVVLYDSIEQHQGKNIKNKNIPHAGKLIQEYIEWLNNQTWLDEIRPEHFTYAGKVFQSFILRQMRKEGYHPITAKRHFVTQD